MQKLYSALAATAIAVCMPPAVSAQIQSPPEVAPVTHGIFTEASPDDGNTRLNIVESLSLPEENATKHMEKAPALRAGAVPGTTTLGQFIVTYSSLVATVGDSGSTVDISFAEGSTSDIIITNFYATGTEIHATLDATGNLSLAGQPLGTITVGSNQYEMELYVVNQDGTPNKDALITGTLNADGSFVLNQWWGVFVKDDAEKYGENAGGLYQAFDQTIGRKPNGKMEFNYKYVDPETSVATTRLIERPVCLIQNNKNQIDVVNFGGYYMTVTINLDRNKGGKIATQSMRDGGSNTGQWMTVGDPEYNENNALVYYSSTINLNRATDLRTITWGEWTGVNTTARTFMGRMLDGKITSEFDITYPLLNVQEFQGEGTEASPYLISTIDELLLLEAKVNDVTEFNEYTELNGNRQYFANIYKDTYFKMTADIDASGYNLTPIGKEWQWRFAGVFDGNGHKITNLKIESPEGRYAGLFGRTSETSVIKNLTLEGADIFHDKQYMGGIAAWSLGLIDNCHVTNSIIMNDGTYAGGIVGEGTKVENCTVYNSIIGTQYGYAGGVASEINKGTIRFCNATATTIRAGAAGQNGDPAGGVVAILFESDAYDCFFSGTVQATFGANMRVGGITGVCYFGKVIRCFNTGLIQASGTEARVGGIVGASIGEIADCYNVGMVVCNGSNNTAGIIGMPGWSTNINDGLVYQTTVRNCFSAGWVECNTYLYDKAECTREVIGDIQENGQPVIENVYFDNQIVNFGSEKYGKTTAELTSASGIPGFSANVWEFTEGYYPRLKSLSGNSSSDYASSVVAIPAGSSTYKVAADVDLRALGSTEFKLYNFNKLSEKLTNEGHYSRIEGSKLVIGEDFGNDTLFVCNGANGRDSRYIILKIAPVPFEGIGTKENPFLIKTKADLIALSVATSEKKQLFADTYFLMTNDIDLEYDPAFLGICSADEVATQFAGSFDGGGHTIHNMLIDAMSWKDGMSPEEVEEGTLPTPNNSSCKSYRGFIGRMGVTGELRNLTLAADCKISLWGYSGALVGYNFGTIDNCRNFADVKGYSLNIGGIVGVSEAGSFVTNCLNAGNIYANNNNGAGIAGSASGTIENCMNVGDITGEKLASNGKLWRNMAGIAGSAYGTFRNVVNAGRVSGGYGGGIFGNFSKSGNNIGNINSAINYGVIACDEAANTGAVCGQFSTEGAVVNVYWDGQIVPLKAGQNKNVENMSALETSALVSGTALEGFDSEIWDFTSGVYPVLKQFAEVTEVADARKAVIIMPAGSTANDMKGTTILQDGCTWALEKGTDFTISGNELKAPASVEDAVSDVLTVKCGTFTKKIDIKAIPACPLSGEGTAESPYLITTPEEWNAFAEYMNIANNTMEGCHIKVANDIDFTDKEFKSFNEGAVSFCGTLDGASHTVKGISKTTSGTYQAAIGTVSAEGTVKNLTLEGNVTSAFANTAGFVANAYGNFENCVNRVNVTSTKGSTGGFAAKIFSGATLTGVRNEASIKSSVTTIGGIAPLSEADITLVRTGNAGNIEYTGTTAACLVAGVIATPKAGVYTEVYNEGEIIVPANAQKVGGLFAQITATAAIPEYHLTGCYNTSSISGAHALGGLIAFSSDNYAQVKAKDCYNEGDITSVSTTSGSNPIAGLFGQVNAGSVIENCYNSGNILSEKTTYIGGVIGTVKTGGNATKTTTITGCYNTGEITANASIGGGIIAMLNTFSTVSGCYNTGAITGGFTLGGIVAQMTGANIEITGCRNEAPVTAKTALAGGLIGNNASGDINVNVNNCYNVGIITSESSTVGTTNATSGFAIGGLAGRTKAVFTDCYNTGTVTGAHQTGGLIGVPYKNTTKLYNCYNAGEIVMKATDGSFGNLIGVNLDPTVNTTNWTESNVVENCHFLTEYNGTLENCASKGTAETYATLATAALGDNWEAGDDYTLPRLKVSADQNSAIAHTAVPVVVAPDVYPTVTGDFKVGNPEGVTWTVSVPDITIDGNDASFGNKPFTGEFTLTARAGKHSHTYTLTADNASALDSLTAGKEIASERYFTVGGIEISKADAMTGEVYIVVTIYTDGKSVIRKTTLK